MHKKHATRRSFPAAPAPFEFPKPLLCFFHQTRDPNQNHRADESYDDGPNHPSARPNPEHSEHPPADNAAENAENDVDQHTISATLHYLPGEPACDKPNHDPVNESHVCPLLFFLFRCEDRDVRSYLLERALPNVNL